MRPSFSNGCCSQLLWWLVRLQLWASPLWTAFWWQFRCVCWPKLVGVNLSNVYFLCVTPNDEVVVPDFGNHRIVMLCSDGTVIRSFGALDGSNRTAVISFPCGLWRCWQRLRLRLWYQIFMHSDQMGPFIRSFCDLKLRGPRGFTVLFDGSLAICDGGAKHVQIWKWFSVVQTIHGYLIQNNTIPSKTDKIKPFVFDYHRFLFKSTKTDWFFQIKNQKGKQQKSSKEWKRRENFPCILLPKNKTLSTKRKQKSIDWNKDYLLFQEESQRKEKELWKHCKQNKSWKKGKY